VVSNPKNSRHSNSQQRVNMLKIVTIIGARPQFIKAATVSRAIAQHNNLANATDLITEILIHTGQHYDDNMSRIFFDELDIPKPHYNLGIGSGPHGKQTGAMLSAIEEVLIREKPDLVLTYGDTNSTLAGALAAAKLHIASAHVEAGLRSYNRKMPEEINRIVADELSNFLFCPTETAVSNLNKEGLANTVNDGTLVGNGLFNDMLSALSFELSPLVVNVGDVMYDSVLFNKNLAQQKSNILQELGIERNNYLLATLHRAENTDDPTRLRNILKAFNAIDRNETRIILPLHPRTQKCIERLTDSKEGFEVDPNITIIKSLGYLDMLRLEESARMILTDSGGVQKEAFFLKVPCITLRDETEWVETIHSGWNTLTGPDTQKILDTFNTISHWDGQGSPFTQSRTQTKPIHPFGDGKAAEKIVDIISKTVRKGRKPKRNLVYPVNPV
jgi:UDP-GlcNAc3NAcA epimerase